MLTNGHQKPIEILLVEDNPGDVRLIQEADIDMFVTVAKSIQSFWFSVVNLPSKQFSTMVHGKYDARI